MGDRPLMTTDDVKRDLKRDLLALRQEFEAAMNPVILTFLSSDFAQQFPQSARWTILEGLIEKAGTVALNFIDGDQAGHARDRVRALIDQLVLYTLADDQRPAS